MLTLRGHNDAVSGVAWSPDGKRLATASGDETAKVWDAGSGEEVLTLRHRNRTDALAFEALIERRGVEIHLVKEACVIGRNSRSQDKFMHDIHVAVAKHCVENLKEEVKKGMREKAEQGIYPGRAPIGCCNNRFTRAIDVDPRRAPIVERFFELYASEISHSVHCEKP